jgi:hypothetical protein
MSTESSPTSSLPAEASVSVSWSEETDSEAGREFVGTIVKAEYPYHDANSPFEGDQVHILVRAEDPPYENLQPIWLPPSNKKGTKFVLFRNHLIKQCPQAWREILPAIQKESDSFKQLQAFCNALVGMRFKFQDIAYPKPNRPNELMNKSLFPVEYKGRGQVTEIKTEKVQL